MPCNTTTHITQHSTDSRTATVTSWDIIQLISGLQQAVKEIPCVFFQLAQNTISNDAVPRSRSYNRYAHVTAVCEPISVAHSAPRCNVCAEILAEKPTITLENNWFKVAFMIKSEVTKDVHQTIDNLRLD